MCIHTGIPVGCAQNKAANSVFYHFPIEINGVCSWTTFLQSTQCTCNMHAAKRFGYKTANIAKHNFQRMLKKKQKNNKNEWF